MSFGFSAGVERESWRRAGVLLRMAEDSVTGGHEPSLALENLSQSPFRSSSSRALQRETGAGRGGPVPGPAIGNAQAVWVTIAAWPVSPLPLVLRAGSNGGDGQDEMDGNRCAGPSERDPVSSRSPRDQE